jgi:MinD-like ATPase involved in chromosome partitioning or flagellar assembly
MPPGAARTLAFISNKGGVGKTHIACNLAIQCARSGRRVLLVDSDLGNASVDLKLGARPTTSLLDFYNDRADIFCCITETQYGFQLLAGGRGDFAFANLPHDRKIRLIRAFDRLVREGGYTDIFFDLGAGISHLVLDFALVTDEIIIVATPNDIVPAYAALKACWTRSCSLGELEYFKDRLNRGSSLPGFLGNMSEKSPDGPRINFIVNQVQNLEEGKKVYLRILQVARSFFYTEDGASKMPARYLGGIPDAYELVKKSERLSTPILLINPYSEFSEGIREIAGVLLGTSAFAPDKLKIPFTDRVRSVISTWSRA